MCVGMRALARARVCKCVQAPLCMDPGAVRACWCCLCRQNNWKLDPPLRRACKEDVAAMCAAEDSKNSEDGLVYKCLIDKYEDIKEGCQKVRACVGVAEGVCGCVLALVRAMTWQG